MASNITDTDTDSDIEDILVKFDVCPSFKTQKSEIHSLLSKPLQTGQKWFLVHIRWFKQWKRFVGYDTWDRSNAGEETARPGPIDNSSLLENQKLRRQQVDEIDYKLVHEEAWKNLGAWYGMSPNSVPICRRVVEYGKFVKQCKVEIYPLELKARLYPYESDFSIIRISRSDTIFVLVKKMRKSFQIDLEKEVRIYNMYMTYTYELIKDLSHQVQDAGLFDGQCVLMEVRNQDGSWPRITQATRSMQMSTYNSNYGTSTKIDPSKSISSEEGSTLRSGKDWKNSDISSKCPIPNKPTSLGNSSFAKSGLQSLVFSQISEICKIKQSSDSSMFKKIRDNLPQLFALLKSILTQRERDLTLKLTEFKQWSDKLEKDKQNLLQLREINEQNLGQNNLFDLRNSIVSEINNKIERLEAESLITLKCDFKELAEIINSFDVKILNSIDSIKDWFKEEDLLIQAFPSFNQLSNLTSMANQQKVCQYEDVQQTAKLETKVRQESNSEGFKVDYKEMKDFISQRFSEIENMLNQRLVILEKTLDAFEIEYNSHKEQIDSDIKLKIQFISEQNSQEIHDESPNTILDITNGIKKLRERAYQHMSYSLELKCDVDAFRAVINKMDLELPSSQSPSLV